MIHIIWFFIISKKISVTRKFNLGIFYSGKISIPRKSLMRFAKTDIIELGLIWSKWKRLNQSMSKNRPIMTTIMVKFHKSLWSFQCILSRPKFLQFNSLLWEFASFTRWRRIWRSSIVLSQSHSNILYSYIPDPTGNLFWFWGLYWGNMVPQTTRNTRVRRYW